MAAPLIGEILSTPLVHPNKDYDVVVAKYGDPLKIYVRCDELMVFSFDTPRKSNVTLPPKVGQKPTIRRKRKKGKS
ncbi:MAG: hypothetical protein ABW022_10980 [Actinoplanes sp.]